MPLPGLKTRALILTTPHLSPRFRGHPERLAGGFERCQRAPSAQGHGGVGAAPPSASAADTSVVWLFHAEMMAKNFEGINWIFSKLVAFPLEKYCDSKSENEQFNIKKKNKKEDLERIAKNNTFSPSPPRALSCNSLRPCRGGAEGLLVRGWKQRDPEEFRNGAIFWHACYFTSAHPGDGERGGPTGVTWT